MSKENYTLFVGDLSLFCNASHLKHAFSKFGEITAVRIAFDDQSQKQLHFGFVEFASYDSAIAALNAMNGTVLCGRILRVKWAINRSDNVTEETKKAANFKLETSSVHVNFLSYQTSKLVSEELLRTVFSAFGEVKDVIIKKSTKDHNIQRGYGFVHYSNTAEGIQSTLDAIANMYDVTVDNVNFTCAMSHACEQGFLSSGSSFPVSPHSSFHSSHSSGQSSPYPGDGYFVPPPPPSTPSMAAPTLTSSSASAGSFYAADPNGQYYITSNSSYDGGYPLLSDPGAAYVTYPHSLGGAAPAVPPAGSFYGSHHDAAYTSAATPGGYPYVFSHGPAAPHFSSQQQQQLPQYQYQQPTSPHHAVMQQQQQHHQQHHSPHHHLQQQQQQQHHQAGHYFVAAEPNYPSQRGYQPHYQQQQQQQQPHHQQQYFHHRPLPQPPVPGQRHSAPRMHYNAATSGPVATSPVGASFRPRPYTMTSVGRSNSEPFMMPPVQTALATRQYHSAQELTPPPTPTSSVATSGSSSKQSSPAEKARQLTVTIPEDGAVAPATQQQQEGKAVSA